MEAATTTVRSSAWATKWEQDSISDVVTSGAHCPDCPPSLPPPYEKGGSLTNPINVTEQKQTFLLTSLSGIDTKPKA